MPSSDQKLFQSFSTGFGQSLIQRLRELALAARGGITQPRNWTFSEPCKSERRSWINKCLPKQPKSSQQQFLRKWNWPSTDDLRCRREICEIFRRRNCVRSFSFLFFCLIALLLCLQKGLSSGEDNAARTSRKYKADLSHSPTRPRGDLLVALQVHCCQSW